MLQPVITEGQKVIDQLFEAIKKTPGGAKLGGGGAAAPEEEEKGGGTGGAPAAPGGATGSCTGGPYKSTGKTVTTSQRGPTTRHYASGKPDDETIEKNAKGVTFKNYQFVSYLTVKTIEHDDNISVKLGGTHDSGWYDHGISFNSGQGCLGTEKNHPNTNSCVVKGKSIGKIVGKKVGIAGVMINGKTEVWGDAGAGWQNLASATNPDNYPPKSGAHECQLRIDGWKSIEIHCSNVQEIAGTGATSALALRQSALARVQYDDFRTRQYQLMNTARKECGFMCSYEKTLIPELQAIQRGLNRG